MRAINLLVIDDSAVVREFIALVVRSVPGINLVGGANSRAEALAMLDGLKVDAVTLDLCLPDCDGTAFLDELTDTGRCGVVVISGDPEYALGDHSREGLPVFDKARLLEQRDEFLAAIRRVARSANNLPGAAHPPAVAPHQGGKRDRAQALIK